MFLCMLGHMPKSEPSIFSSNNDTNLEAWDKVNKGTN